MFDIAAKFAVHHSESQVAVASGRMIVVPADHALLLVLVERTGLVILSAEDEHALLMSIENERSSAGD